MGSASSTLLRILAQNRRLALWQVSMVVDNLQTLIKHIWKAEFDVAGMLKSGYPGADGYVDI
jgi:hypothetical protein